MHGSGLGNSQISELSSKPFGHWVIPSQVLLSKRVAVKLIVVKEKNVKAILFMYPKG